MPFKVDKETKLFIQLLKIFNGKEKLVTSVEDIVVPESPKEEIENVVEILPLEKTQQPSPDNNKVEDISEEVEEQ